MHLRVCIVHFSMYGYYLFIYRVHSQLIAGVLWESSQRFIFDPAYVLKSDIFIKVTKLIRDEMIGILAISNIHAISLFYMRSELPNNVVQHSSSV